MEFSGMADISFSTVMAFRVRSSGVVLACTAWAANRHKTAINMRMGFPLV
jgi:hypothetical protein